MLGGRRFFCALDPVSMSQAISLPAQDDLIADLRALASRSDAISRYLAAVEAGCFTHPDGRKDPWENVTLRLEQAALLSYLSRLCPTPISAETGFGMGSSASVILGTRRLQESAFTHFAFDPFGLPDDRGKIVGAYLEEEFPGCFQRLESRSQVGLAKLIETHGEGVAGLIYIDADHRFEGVMADFALADLLCCPGGYIVLDDAPFPPIETVVNYIVRNRPDYAVAHRVTRNASVLCKRGPDERDWCAFTPFDVPNRHNWTRSPDPDR